LTIAARNYFEQMKHPMCHFASLKTKEPPLKWEPLLTLQSTAFTGRLNGNFSEPWKLGKRSGAAGRQRAKRKMRTIK
jgi:hypothetical protein